MGKESATPARERAAARRRERGVPTKGDLREQALLDALEELIGEAPLASASIDRIAARAGVSRTTFYFYFRSKEAALQALIERSFASIWDAAGGWLFEGGDSEHSLEHAIEGLVAAWLEHSPLLTAVVDATSYDDGIRALWESELEGFIVATTERIERDAAKGAIRPGLDARSTAEALCWMNERYSYVYFRSGQARRDPGHAARALYEVWHATLYGG